VCRTRRVKCDEAKPECNRCLNYNRICSGYIHELAPKPAPQQIKILLRKRVTVEPLCRPPATKLFRTDQEYIFFQRFYYVTVGELTGVRGSELWSRVVLQATEEEPCLRHAAIAVGALDFQDLAVGERSDDPEEATRHEFAYSEYHKAIVGLRKVLATSDCTIMTKLISCILFACFEAHHRNNETAFRQLFAGIGMIEEYSKLQKGSLGRLPALDEDVVQAFALLEIQASAMGDQRSAEVHLEKLRACNEAIKPIPAEFKTLKDAEYVLYMNMLRGIHLRFSEMNVTDISSNVSGSPIIGLGTCSTRSACSQLSRILGALRQWDEAFQTLYRKAQSPQGRHLLKGATLLRLHYLSSVAWTAVGSPDA